MKHHKKNHGPPYTNKGLVGSPDFQPWQAEKRCSSSPERVSVREGWIANWVFQPYLVIMKSFPPPQSQSISGDHVGAVNRCHAHPSQEGINRELMQSQIPSLFTSSHPKCQWRLCGEPGILVIPGNMEAVPTISLLECCQEKKTSKSRRFK